MQLTDKNTGYVCIRANTTSDWDEVSFAIFIITEELITQLQETKPIIDRLKSMENFLEISFQRSLLGWFTDHDDIDFDEDKLWSFIDITVDEIEALHKPQQRIDSGLMYIGSDAINFVAHSKSSSDEFSTEGIAMKDIIS